MSIASQLSFGNAAVLSTGTLSGDRGVTAGSVTTSFVEYNGTTAVPGQFDGGSIAPSATVRLNFNGNLHATYFIGNGSQLTGINTSSTSINNGTSNVNIPTINGNINFSTAGNANVVVITNTGIVRNSLNIPTFAYSSATPPVSAQSGDQWFNTTTGILFEYLNDGTSSQWIDVGTVPNMVNFVPTLAYRTTFTNTNITNTDGIILANGVLTITLPNASEVPGRQFYIKNINTSNALVTIVPIGTDLIDGKANASIAFYNTMLGVISISTGWILF